MHFFSTERKHSEVQHLQHVQLPGKKEIPLRQLTVLPVNRSRLAGGGGGCITAEVPIRNKQALYLRTTRPKLYATVVNGPVPAVAYQLVSHRHLRT